MTRKEKTLKEIEKLIEGTYYGKLSFEITVKNRQPTLIKVIHSLTIEIDDGVEKKPMLR